MKWLVLLMLAACEGSHAGPPTQAAEPITSGQAVAVFAGGCFWCMEGPFEKLDGVHSVESGYTGGPEIRPSYRAVASGETGHFEAVRVVYNPAKVSYLKLLDVFWHNIDPTQSNGQFCDKGDQYRSAIFVADAAEQAQAESSKRSVSEALGRPAVTPILAAAVFWVAEEYHQDFYKRNPTRYKSYRAGCGRDHRLQKLWGDAAGH